MEEISKVQRSEMWEIIYNIVNKIPRIHVVGDAMDAVSAATLIEEYFLKTCNEPHVSKCEGIEREPAVCPTCGSECYVGGKDGETRYFIPAHS